MSTPPAPGGTTSANTHFYTFVRSCDVTQPVNIALEKLVGDRSILLKHAIQGCDTDTDLDPDLLDEATPLEVFVEYSIEDTDIQLQFRVESLHQSYIGSQSEWTETLQLPVCISNLPRASKHVLRVFVLGVEGQWRLAGKASLPVFDTNGMLQWGRHILTVKAANDSDSDSDRLMQQLVSRIHDHEDYVMPRPGWLDELTSIRLGGRLDDLQQNQKDRLHLHIELVRFQPAVLYCEMGGEMPSSSDHRMWLDPELNFTENLVEAKHHKQMRGHRRGVLDRHLKPNPELRDRLARLVHRPLWEPFNTNEKDLFWRFRYYLQKEKKALPKFVRCVNWEDDGDVQQAIELIRGWAEPDIDDALGLLAKDVTHPVARGFAVERLRRADNEELQLYLLQLVQALRYEPSLRHIAEAHRNSMSVMPKMSRRQAKKLRAQAAKLGQTPPQAENGTDGGGIGEPGLEDLRQDAPADEQQRTTSQSNEEGSVGQAKVGFEEEAENEKEADEDDDNDADTQGESTAATEQNQDDEQASSVEDRYRLDLLLIERAKTDYGFASALAWFVRAETRQRDIARYIFQHMEKSLRRALKHGDEQQQGIYKGIQAQRSFVRELESMSASLKASSLSRPAKITELKRRLLESSFFQNLQGLALPVDPAIVLKKIVPDDSKIFKSAMNPMGLYFETMADTKYGIIFKHGDDIRQDQLVLQVITLMDRLLKRENLDLKLTPYRCLATSDASGMVELVFPAEALARINSRWGSIQKYLAEFNRDESGPNGITKQAMDNYVRSCAGYSVITYLLGVGDRHLDNLLLTQDGRIFHIDFGYLLGRDPKPYPPPMKLTKDMVEAMGGIQSDEMRRFCTYCFDCFLILRKNANLILNLFALMVDSDVHDIALDRDKCVKAVQDKFCLDQNDEEAVQVFQDLLENSMAALFPRLMDTAHFIAQLLRK